MYVPLTPQNVIEIDFRICGFLWKKQQNRNFFSVTLDHVIETDTCCYSDIFSYEAPLWTFWCDINPSSLLFNKQDVLCLTIGTNQCGCQSWGHCRCMVLSPPAIAVRELFCSQWGKNNSQSFSNTIHTNTINCKGRVWLSRLITRICKNGKLV